MKKLFFILSLFPFFTFASFPTINDTIIKKETIEEYNIRINKQFNVNDKTSYNNTEYIQEVKPFIDIEKVPPFLKVGLFIPGVNGVILLYILFAYGNKAAKFVGVLLIMAMLLSVWLLFKWAESFSYP